MHKFATLKFKNFALYKAANFTKKIASNLQFFAFLNMQILCSNKPIYLRPLNIILRPLTINTPPLQTSCQYLLPRQEPIRQFVLL